MINLNDDQFDGGGNVKIFNGGKAGIVDNVKVSVVRKGKDDKPNSPEFKLNFTDPTGGTCSTPFWVVENETQYKTVDELIQAQGKVLKHILHAVYGKDFSIPAFGSAKEMLSGSMKLIHDGLAAAPSFRMIANYGVPSYSKAFIQPRSWVPFMEPMSVDIADTRLALGDLDCLTRLTKDEIPAGNTDDLMSSDKGGDWD